MTRDNELHLCAMIRTIRHDSKISLTSFKGTPCNISALFLICQNYESDDDRTLLRNIQIFSRKKYDARRNPIFEKAGTSLLGKYICSSYQLYQHLHSSYHFISIRPSHLLSQLREASNSSVAVDAEREAWNRLIDANVRSGIMACIWCMKAQVVKITAMAFHKWKTCSLLDMSKIALLNSISNQHSYNDIHEGGLNNNSNERHVNCFSNNFNNIPFDPNGRDATMEAAAAAAQYFQQLMLQIPLNEYSNIKINIPTEPNAKNGRGVKELTAKGKL